ncbi:MAG: ATP-binding cassette domain-containing protein, partial [Candidatus Phytoplasma stylosanthis]|nr:ATP-binding cassette domain-containing protein [Candidatus Phytoplasma stylosanthis]
MDKQILIDIQNLSKNFLIKKKLFEESQNLKAVQNVDLLIFKGETLAVVGGSGSGKSTLGQLISQLQIPTSGNIFYYKDIENKIDLTNLNNKQKRPLRKDLQIIFQDPFSSLNPSFKIADIIGEGLLIYKMVKNKKDTLYNIIILDIWAKCQIDRSVYDR